MRKLCKMTRFISAVAALMFIAPVFGFAQNTISVSGVVLDEANEPIIGASVMVKGTTQGVPTDLDGKYTISVPSNAVLEFSSIGLKTVTENVNGRTTINVVLATDNTFLESVVVVGYGTQRRGSITGAISGVDSDNIVKTKSENPQNMLTGKVAGLRVWQTSAEPGSYSATMDIRGLGDPLIVIDGVPRTVSDFQRLTADDIENVSILKDASAAIYGVRGANGVVLVSTKQGQKGTSKVTYNGSFTFQTPSGLPELLGAYEAMTLMNDNAMHSVTGGSRTYSEEYIQDWVDGKYKTTDWNSLVIQKMAPQTQHSVSISGGSDRIQYYVGAGYNYQEGFFKSGDLNYNKKNVRSNITAEVIDGLKVNLNLSGYMDTKNSPYTSAVYLIRNWWKQGVLHPAYADPDNTLLNYENLELEQNTVAMMTSDISGYNQTNQKNFTASASVEFDFGTYIKALQGLTLKGMYSYDYRMNYNEVYRKEYYLYAYDKLTDSYAQKVYADSSPSHLKRSFYEKTQNLGQVTLNYNRDFGQHKVGALVGYEAQKRMGDNFYGEGDLAFSSPYFTALTKDGQVTGMSSSTSDFYELAYKAVIGRLNYSYADRYIIEGQFRYDGSSKFAPGHQWGFFPSGSAAWRISEEPFFKDSNLGTFINQLKLRASYGILGDDSGLNYEWVTGYTYSPSSSSNGWYTSVAPGYYFGSNFIYGVTNKSIPNENITWYTSHTFDVGIDFEAWNGLLGATLDYFHRTRTGLFATKSSDLPTVVGNTASTENANSDSHFGFDLELSHRNRVGDFNYRVKAIGTITRRKYLTYVQKSDYGNTYANWKSDTMNNRYQGISWGYEGAGRFESWNDIWSYDIYQGNSVLPGDYKYEDWNGDGVISSLDSHPIRYDSTPWMNYSLSFDCSWRSLDFSILFQGTALGSMQYQEPLYSIWGTDSGGTLTQYWDRWHPEDANYTDPYDPSLKWISGYYGFTGSYPNSSSSFNRVSTAYLRVKTIEIGYTLPKLKALPNASLRIFANAYNPFTITAVKFVDPEHPDDDLGRMYPLSKNYTLGVNLSF